MNFWQNVFPWAVHVGPCRFLGLFSASRRGCELLLTLALLSTSICDAASTPSSRWVVSETDDHLVCREPDGNEVTLAKRPKRVVIAYGSLVGVWYCSGGTAVGITSVDSKKTK